MIIDGMPFGYYCARFCNICIWLFMLLSGYGLWIVYCKKQEMHNIKRVFNLLKKVTYIAALFLPFSLLFKNLKWDINAVTVMQSIIGYKPFNMEWWFIFPYIILALFSQYIFHLFAKWGGILTIASFAIYLATRVIIKFWGEAYIEGISHLLYLLLLTLALSFPFLLGASMARYGWLERARQIYHNNRLIKLSFWGAFCLLMYVRMFIINGLFDPIVSMLLCFFTVGAIEHCKPMQLLGTHSTTMWLIHTFLCTYYLHDFFYGFKNDLLIYVSLVFISFLLSYLLDTVYNTLRSIKVSLWKMR